jgi:Potassium-transporting ATPase A subunit
MTLASWVLIALFILFVVAFAKPAGLAMHRLYDTPLLPGEATWRRWIGSGATQEQSWLGYAAALMVFNVLGIAMLFAVLKLQGMLPFNPRHFGGGGNGVGAEHCGQLRHQHQESIPPLASDPSGDSNCKPTPWSAVPAGTCSFHAAGAPSCRHALACFGNCFDWPPQFREQQSGSTNLFALWWRPPH